MGGQGGRCRLLLGAGLEPEQPPCRHRQLADQQALRARQVQWAVVDGEHEERDQQRAHRQRARTTGRRRELRFDAPCDP